MGWDVVQIGLGHDLPVDDPHKTAQEIAKRMERNVTLAYYKKYEYDIASNVIHYKNKQELIELGRYEVDDSKSPLLMTVADYQVKQILDLVGIDKLRKATFANDWASDILYEPEEPFELYEIEDDEGDLDIWIFKENVDLDIHSQGRWNHLERTFHQPDENRERLHDYRMQIYNRAKLFGCKDVIICADQGPTESIVDNLNYTADRLREYARTYEYLNGYDGWDSHEVEEWKKEAKHIMFSSVFQGQINLSDTDFVEVIYDDFRDLINAKN